MNENEPIVELEDVTEPDENCGWTDQDMLETFIKNGSNFVAYTHEDFEPIYEDFCKKVWENLEIPPTTTFVVATAPVLLYKSNAHCCKTRAIMVEGTHLNLDPIEVAKEVSEYIKGHSFFAFYMIQLVRTVRVDSDTPRIGVKIRFAE